MAHIGASGDLSFIELIGTSTTSWEEGARNAVERAARNIAGASGCGSRDLVVTDAKVEAYRTKLKVSFKYEGRQ
jgi:dodecin